MALPCAHRALCIPFNLAFYASGPHYTHLSNHHTALQDIIKLTYADNGTQLASDQIIVYCKQDDGTQHRLDNCTSLAEAISELTACAITLMSGHSPVPCIQHAPHKGQIMFQHLDMYYYRVIAPIPGYARCRGMPRYRAHDHAPSDAHALHFALHSHTPLMCLSRKAFLLGGTTFYFDFARSSPSKRLRAAAPTPTPTEPASPDADSTHMTELETQTQIADVLSVPESGEPAHHQYHHGQHHDQQQQLQPQHQPPPHEPHERQDQLIELEPKFAT